MNPLTNMKNVLKLSESDLKHGQKSSWHDQYRNSAWIFVGGLPYDLTEGDVLAIFSQYGEIVNINLVRDKDTGKQKGFCFVCYEDQRSTVLAVDNLNGIKILSRTLRIDHVNDYRPPKDHKNLDDITKLLHKEGCAPQLQIPINEIKKESSSDVVGMKVSPPPSHKIKLEEKSSYRPVTATIKNEHNSIVTAADIELPKRLPIGKYSQNDDDQIDVSSKKTRTQAIESTTRSSLKTTNDEDDDDQKQQKTKHHHREKVDKKLKKKKKIEIFKTNKDKKRDKRKLSLDSN